MGNRRVICGALSIVAVLAASGCGTAPKKFQDEVSGIKTRVETLESKVDFLEAGRTVTGGPTQMTDEGTGVFEADAGVKVPGGRDKEGVREIQSCLKNAGFYSGGIDGIKGKRTRKAIRDFQEANGLATDGIVGKKTWELLSKYAQGAGGSDEGAAAK